MTRSPSFVAVAVGVVVAALVLALRAGGWLQGPELALYDLYLRTRAAPPGSDSVDFTESPLSVAETPAYPSYPSAGS